MKVSELTGAQLDYWVAKAEGMQHVRINRDAEPHACYMWESERGLCSGDAYSPSSIWKQGGPIIERERITIAATGRTNLSWFAEISGFASDCGVEVGCGEHSAEADTPLVAAMRTYVTSKFGDEVPDEAPETR